MAGIYLHIPFCKKKCHYCDFHFSTNLTTVQKMVDAICVEAILRKAELKHEEINTIYFGGGTPSVLSQKQLSQLLTCISENFQLAPNPEVTLEANPENLSKEYLQILKSEGVNRLSVGLQSFDDEVLDSMNRAHTASESERCVRNAVDAGFKSISIDLIYGVPKKDLTYWKEQVKAALDLGANHISAYCLTVEENTVYAHMQKVGDLKMPDDEENLAQFHYLVQELASHGFDQYEISNFAKEGGISKHNSAYWLGEKYLGLGPSAHSFDGSKRSWNIRNNPQYIKLIEQQTLPSEAEVLSPEDQFNDYVLTRLRTKWGLSLATIQKLKSSVVHPDFERTVEGHINGGNLIKRDEHLFLTKEGKFIADRIASDLFV